MKKIIWILLAIIIFAVAGVGYKYKELLMLGIANEPIETVAKKQAKTDELLVQELKDLGIQIDKIGDSASLGSAVLESDQTASKVTTSSNSAKAQTGAVKNKSGQAQPAPQNQSVTAEKPSQSTITLKYYNEFIAFKVGYEAEISEMFQSAKVSFTNLPPEEQTTSKLMAMGLNYANKATDLEKKADQKCEALMLSFEAELKQYQYDTLIVKQVREYYNQYKTAQKAYYLAKLKD